MSVKSHTTRLVCHLLALVDSHSLKNTDISTTAVNRHLLLGLQSATTYEQQHKHDIPSNLWLL